MPRPALPYILWCCAFLLACLASLFLVNNDATAQNAFVGFGWFFGVSLILCFLVQSPVLVRACGYGIVTAVLVLSVLSIMEFLNPDFQVVVDALFEDQTRVGELNRSGSLYLNPNDNGTAMVLGMVAGLYFVPRQLRFIFMLLVGAAVFGTVSRGSLTIWAIAVVMSLILGFGTKNKVFGLVGVLFVILLGYLLISGQVPEILASFGFGNLLSVDMVQRLSQNFFTQEDGSTLGRIAVAREAWAFFLENSISGIGLGASDVIEVSGTSVGTHNQHLKIASEMGVFGLLIYAGLFFVALKSGSALAFTFIFLYAVISVTNHSMMTYTVYAVLIPAALVFVPVLQRNELQNQPRSRRRRRRKRRSLSTSERELSA